MTSIRQHERDTVIQALRAGVVPRVGQRLFQVGRSHEIESLTADIDRIAAGGTTFRLVVGDYGAGKTFFLNLTHSIALEKRLVATRADLTPDRRLQASGGQARLLYAELMRNLATRSKPDGNALESILQRFVADCQALTGGPAELVINKRLSPLRDLVGGHDFTTVLLAYCKGFAEHNETLCSDALRWLRGEYTTRTEAREALGVRTIIDDAQIYDHLKLFGVFCAIAGYRGLLVAIDEAVNLFKLSHAATRKANYEQILRILNDLLQGNAQNIGILIGGTTEFLLDPRRGLYSYEALQTRLRENQFAGGRSHLVDYHSTVIRLSPLTQEDFFVLLQRLRNVYATGDPDRYLIDDAGIEAFMIQMGRTIGARFYMTPRNAITAYLDLLAVLEQNPGTQWSSLLTSAGTAASLPDAEPAIDPAADDLTSFNL